MFTEKTLVHLCQSQGMQPLNAEAEVTVAYDSNSLIDKSNDKSNESNTGVGGVFLPISKAIAILSSEQLQGCSLLSLLFLHINLICITMSATTLSNERQSNTEQNPANKH